VCTLSDDRAPASYAAAIGSPCGEDTDDVLAGFIDEIRRVEYRNEDCGGGREEGVVELEWPMLPAPLGLNNREDAEIADGGLRSNKADVRRSEGDEAMGLLCIRWPLPKPLPLRPEPATSGVEGEANTLTVLDFSRFKNHALLDFMLPPSW